MSEGLDEENIFLYKRGAGRKGYGTTVLTEECFPFQYI